MPLAHPANANAPSLPPAAAPKPNVVPERSALAQAYFAATDTQTLREHPPAALEAMAQSHARLLHATPAGGTAVQVFNPSLAQAGWTQTQTLVQVVHPNMPFLVDSVIMAVNRCARMAEWVIHPMWAITRDAQGGIVQSQIAQPGHAGEVVSLIAVHVDRLVDGADRDALAQAITQALADVRAAVGDWAAMLAQVDALCQASAQAPIDPAQRSEGLALLRWLQDQHFTFLGLRDYALEPGSGAQWVLRAIESSGLGLLRGPARTACKALDAGAQAFAQDDTLLRWNKALTRSSVHRPAWLDVISVKRFDAQGQLVGETRLLGLLTSRAYGCAADAIPGVRQRVAHVRAQAGFLPNSHDAKALEAVLDAYPRDELFQVDAPTLSAHALGILRLQEAQRCRVFLRRDAHARYTSALVFVPRERYDTELRQRIGALLLDSLDGESLEYTPTLTDAPMARVHFLLRARTLAPLHVDASALQAEVERLAQRWDDTLKRALLRRCGETAGLVLARRFGGAFDAAYCALTDAETAAHDVCELAQIDAAQPLIARLGPSSGDAGVLLRLYSRNKLALSDILPLLENLGAHVLDERAHAVQAADGALWLHVVGLVLPQVDLSAFKARFEDSLVRTWAGVIESDALGALVLHSTLDADAIGVLRAYVRYFRQIGYPYSQAAIEAALLAYPEMAQTLCDWFAARLGPQGDAAAQQAAQQRFATQLAGVRALEHDHILRQLAGAIAATLRTNAWAPRPEGDARACLSLKFDARAMPGLPDPRPLFEVWVYSPRFEGIHLRFGRVARGGIRWSDRREDFRTEVLGLVKAQQVKNTVIVPVGAKGGFVLKRAPQSREALQAEGVACYQLYLGSLLDLTDNRVGDQVVTPAGVRRHDADDPYLVVAADKGTATFSDIANGVAQARGFWLDDAFASGGSVGYDHKKMGITARGAWISAQRHFRALGLDVQTQCVRALGIGDMSGDVFGNGLLRSPALALVAAFDHRHIFIDPTPDVAAAFAERARLFALPRSSWDDYARRLISAGGGVWSRAEKTIALSAPVQALLGVDAAELAPHALIHALLRAPLDLIYNGGIGTYIKSRSEGHAQVGDKANDAVRVDGADVRARVLVEGGNLGCTQLGRIEYAKTAGRIYSDAIDNSAGVDCSDHEVNLKILLAGPLHAGALTRTQRDALLAQMTDDVAQLVLQDNYYQTQAIDVALAQGVDWLAEQQRLMRWLEGAGRLDRRIEALPDDSEIARRRAAGHGLTAPENAVLLAYAKMALYDDLLASDLPDEAAFEPRLMAYFPPAVVDKLGPPALLSHPLRREIVATVLANSVINRLGATAVNRLAAEAAVPSAAVVRAYTLAREVFDLEAIWDRIDTLDTQMNSALQIQCLAELIRVAQRVVRRLLRRQGLLVDLAAARERYQALVQLLRTHLDAWSGPAAGARRAAQQAAWVGQGLPADLAAAMGALGDLSAALSLCDLVGGEPSRLQNAARIHFALEDSLQLGAWRTLIDALPTQSLWQTQARASARSELEALGALLDQQVLAGCDAAAADHAAAGSDPADVTALSAWQTAHAAGLERVGALLGQIQQQGADLAAVSVGLRALKQLAELA